MGDRASAINFFNQAVHAVNDKTNPQHLQLAYQLFSSACHVDPTWIEGWFHAGNNNSELGLLPAAVACYRRAMECDPKGEDLAKILTNIGWRLHSLGLTKEALEFSDRAIDIEPSVAYAWVNLSCIHGTLDDSEKAIECAREAFRLMPLDSTVEMALAFALLFGRKFEEGFKYFESRFKYKLKDYLQFPYPKWDGESGKTVFLSADQGLGDTLSFARFVEETCRRSKYVHARIQPELMRLFSHAFMHIPNINLIPGNCPFPAADAWTTFVSLPTALKLNDAEIRAAKDIDIPVLGMPVNWKVSDRKLHIGVAWAGSPLNDIDKHRNIPVTMFLELCRVPGVQLYALQVGEKSKEMHENGMMAIMRDMSPYIRDVADTVALVNKLDFVITCESAMGHICAAADKECWVPYSYLGRDYRIGLTGEDRLWTPKHRIFRQDNTASWDPVFKEIVVAVRERLDDPAG